MAWFSRKNIPYDTNTTRVELLDLVRLIKPKMVHCVLDALAHARGHNVVRMPPYRYHYNPIELGWAQVKHEEADKNTFRF
jgi:transposase